MNLNSGIALFFSLCIIAVGRRLAFTRSCSVSGFISHPHIYCRIHTCSPDTVPRLTRAISSDGWLSVSVKHCSRKPEGLQDALLAHYISQPLYSATVCAHMPSRDHNASRSVLLQWNSEEFAVQFPHFTSLYVLIAL